MIIPGSHLKTHFYGSKADESGKLKPTYIETENLEELIAAPVKVGSAVVFNDELLHGGRSTNSLRISIEFTLACMSPNASSD